MPTPEPAADPAAPARPSAAGGQAAPEASGQGPSAGVLPVPPQPRRTRGGRVLVGPSLPSRYLPGALIGLPLVSILLGSFPAAALQQWRNRRVLAGHWGPLEQALSPVWLQLLAGIVLLWTLLALWALVALVLTRRVVEFDEETGTLLLRKGLRIRDRARVEHVRFAVGGFERSDMALIGIAEDPQTEPRQWVVPFIGWDGPSFDGLRALQAAAGYPAAPDRAGLIATARADHRLANRREYARRLQMPWRPEYESDPLLFRRDFDRARHEARAAERSGR